MEAGVPSAGSLGDDLLCGHPGGSRAHNSLLLLDPKQWRCSGRGKLPLPLEVWPDSRSVDTLVRPWRHAAKTSLVLTLTAAIWLQVEYRVKQFVPWAILMSDGPSSLEALSIDYFSPYSPVVFISSIRRRHWPVTTVVLATWLLQLAIVFSTGLLERELLFSTVTIDGLPTTASFKAAIDFPSPNQ